MISRRVLALGAAAGSIALPSMLRAQSGPKVIGVLSPYTSRDFEPFRDVFLRAMLELGYVRGKHYVLVERFAEGKNERLRDLAAELAKIKVDVIFAFTTNAVSAAQQVTATIPIVYLGVSDPVRAGFAESLARPGRNMTGLSNFSGELGPKRFELLKQMVPSLTRVAILVNPTNPYYSTQMQRMQPSAEQLGMRMLFVSASTPEDLEPAFQTMIQQRAEAVVVVPDAYLSAQRQRIAELALRSRLPSMFAFAECVEVGGLMSYGADTWPFQQAATYVDKIFRGVKPGEISIEQPTRVVLVINRKTADALGLTVPRTLLLRAEKVIE